MHSEYHNSYIFIKAMEMRNYDNSEFKKIIT